MKRSSSPLLCLVLVVTGLLCLTRPAAAELAISEQYHYQPSGFVLQPLLSGATAISAPGTQSLLIIPSLRLGYVNRYLAVLLDVSYIHSAAVGGYDDVDIVTAGADAMPFVWRRLNGRARLYLLGGFNVGAAFGGHPHAGPDLSAQMADSAGRLTGGLLLGVGGDYFVRPRFALGVELGSRTQFFHRADGTDIISSLYAGITGTFAAAGR